LESANFLGDDIPTEVAVVAAFLEEAAAPADAQDVAAQPMVSLYAIAGIQTENAMHLPVSIHGHRLVALLDSGSTHNFIDDDLMRHLL
jgi:predicted CoA-binding protein